MPGMPPESKQITEWIARHAADVYEYASDPANLPNWAPGLASSVTNVDGQWYVETQSGRLAFAFVERNEHGVLDHTVTLRSGDVIYNPMRVVPHGDGSEVAFSLRRQPEMSDEDFARDTGLVQADLTRLKHVLEGT